MVERRFHEVRDKVLTRISVKGVGNSYLVRLGQGPVMEVRKEHGDLVCECGEPKCAHIDSLGLCGFVETDRDLPMAA